MSNVIKYNPEDIDRIFCERVTIKVDPAQTKPGIIVEWNFQYPNGNSYSDVVCSFPVDPSVYNVDIGTEVCVKKIKDELWKICGQYSLITGEKL